MNINLKSRKFSFLMYNSPGCVPCEIKFLQCISLNTTGDNLSHTQSSYVIWSYLTWCLTKESFFFLNKYNICPSKPSFGCKDIENVVGIIPLSFVPRLTFAKFGQTQIDCYIVCPMSNFDFLHWERICDLILIQFEIMQKKIQLKQCYCYGRKLLQD